MNSPMFARLCLLIILLLTIFQSASRSAAQDEPKLCLSANYGNQDIFVRYRASTHELTLVSWNSGKTLQTLETAFNSAIEILAWSSDCHYLVAIVDGSTPKPTAQQITIWDVNSNKRIGMLNAPRPRYLLSWSPNNDAFVIQTAQGGYLWYLPTNHQVLLNPQADDSQRNFYRLEWDMQRNELLAVQVGSANGVTAYRLADGQRSGFFYVSRPGALVNYRHFENDQLILVYETAEENFWKNTPMTFALWNRATQANIQLRAPDITPFWSFDITGNMNSHFFILSLYAGDSNISPFYVWDLQKPVSSSPYVPKFWRTTAYGADGIRFTDDHTIEVVDWTYAAYNAGPIDMRARRFDLNTGDTMFEVRGISHRRCRDGSLQKLPEHALLE